MSHYLTPEKRALLGTMLDQGFSGRRIVGHARIAKGTVARYRRLLAEVRACYPHLASVPSVQLLGMLDRIPADTTPNLEAP